MSKLTKNQIVVASLLGAVGVGALIYGKRYFNGASCTLAKDLTGKVVIVTGSSGGIGKETARELARMKATTLQVVDEIKSDTGNQSVEFSHLDLASLESIQKFTEDFKAKYNRLDILINNACVAYVQKRVVTKDGFELHFGTNHLGHFYLTILLLNLIKKSAPSRIVNVSSIMHLSGLIDWEDIMLEKKYTPHAAYANSKLANVIFSNELQRRLDIEGADVKVVSLHPGTVKTDAGRHLKGRIDFKIFAVPIKILSLYFCKNAKQGAQTSLYCSIEDHEVLKGGGYYDDCRLSKINPLALQEENGKKLWEISEKLIKEKINAQN